MGVEDRILSTMAAFEIQSSTSIEMQPECTPRQSMLTSHLSSLFTPGDTSLARHPLHSRESFAIYNSLSCSSLHPDSSSIAQSSNQTFWIMVHASTFKTTTILHRHHQRNFSKPGHWTCVVVATFALSTWNRTRPLQRLRSCSPTSKQRQSIRHT